MKRFLEEVARQIAAGDWEDVEEAAYARGVPRPGDGSDQPSLPVDDDGWGFPIPTGTQQPTLW